MRFKILFVVALSSFCFSRVYAQQLSGIATYQTQRHVDIKLDSSTIGGEQQRLIQEQLRKQFQKEYQLTFNGSESLWKEVSSLDKPQAPSGSGIQIITSSNHSKLYHNVAQEKLLHQTDLMGKVFLVSDTLAKKDWKLEKAVKNIGQYTCFKATYTEEYEVQSYTSSDVESTNKKETKTTTVWYTLDIPVSHGPENFWGLPGLVIEVNDGKMAMMCTKVVINPEEEVSIEIPHKGKKVTGKEFEIIREEKNKEMIERYQNNGSKKNGSNSFTIEVRG